MPDLGGSGGQPVGQGRRLCGYLVFDACFDGFGFKKVDFRTRVVCATIAAYCGGVWGPIMNKRGFAARPTLSAHVIFLRYILFAFLAGCCNLAMQDVVLRIFAEASIAASLLAGTASGFLVKYILDKTLIFHDKYRSHSVEMRKIVISGLFSVGTTLLFWSIELSFWYMWGTSEAKYIGAAIGLALGNWLKYWLDRSWVFNQEYT